MDTLTNIFERKSIREYKNTPISQEDMQAILKAGMSGPSCANRRDWAFIVVTKKDTLLKMAAANGQPAAPLKKAAAAILVCGDLSLAFPSAKDYWVIDGSIAMQNMTLAENALGIGSVWLGTWPQMERVKKQAEIFALPEHIIPHSILALGYKFNEDTIERNLTEADKVHFEKW